MTVRRAALIFIAAISAISCSEKSAPERVNDTKKSEAPREPARAAESTTAPKADLPPPSENQIERECLALLRSTKVASAQPPRADCPGCPAGGTELLTVRQIKTDAVSCSGDTCNALVTIRAVFNPGAGETIAGGLTAWIPPEQRRAYLSGQIPSDEQVYRVQITYRHGAEAWQAVEFDRAPAE